MNLYRLAAILIVVGTSIALALDSGRWLVGAMVLVLYGAPAVLAHIAALPDVRDLLEEQP